MNFEPIAGLMTDLINVSIFEHGFSIVSLPVRGKIVARKQIYLVESCEELLVHYQVEIGVSTYNIQYNSYNIRPLAFLLLFQAIWHYSCNNIALCSLIIKYTAFFYCFCKISWLKSIQPIAFWILWRCPFNNCIPSPFPLLYPRRKAIWNWFKDMASTTILHCRGLRGCCTGKCII